MIEEYSKTGIAALLMEYAEIEDSPVERIVIMRCDLEQAVARLPVGLHKIVNTILMLGSTDEDVPRAEAVACNAVTEEEFTVVVTALHRILNKEGLCPASTSPASSASVVKSAPANRP